MRYFSDKTFDFHKPIRWPNVRIPSRIMKYRPRITQTIQINPTRLVAAINKTESISYDGVSF